MLRREFQSDKGRGWLLRWLPSRAHDNGLFLLFANGVGLDDDEVRTGNAMIIDTYGRILAETWAAEDAMVVADLKAELRGNSTGERAEGGGGGAIFVRGGRVKLVNTRFVGNRCDLRLT